MATYEVELEETDNKVTDEVDGFPKTVTTIFKSYTLKYPKRGTI